MPENATGRLEAFCDAVIAIAITLLILEIKVPSAEAIHSPAELQHYLLSRWPSWFAFVLTFGMILISWTNHHAFFRYLNKCTMLFLFANGLFVLTIVVMPYPASLIAEFLTTPSVKPAAQVYTFVLLVHNISWVLLFRTALSKKLYRSEEARVKLKDGLRSTLGGTGLYIIIFVLTFWFPLTGLVLMTLSWMAWVVVGLLFSDKE